MARWNRSVGTPVAPAPGMILPGVPLAPLREGKTQVLDGDPLADPERERAAREARAAQPLPVRIVASTAPAPETNPTETNRTEPIRTETTTSGVESAGVNSSEIASPVTRPATAARPQQDVQDTAPSPVVPSTAPTVTAEVSARPTSRPTSAPPPAPETRVDDVAPPAPSVPHQRAPRSTPKQAPATSSPRSGLAAGPWPDPDGPAWPRTIPSWGRPPRGFAGRSARVAVVMKDGTQVSPGPQDARAMLGVAASLGV